MSGALDGIRVLEFTQAIAGPFGCMMLADMGAEVLKIEPLEGEAWRVNNPFMPGEAKSYQAMNRGKFGLALDLRRPEAQRAIHRIVENLQVDVVITNARPDVPKKLRYDYETLKTLRPELIYIAASAFGSKGPWALHGGYDGIIQAASGMMGSAGLFEDYGAPMIPRLAVADFATAYSIAWATCAALFYRERTGKGQLVETSMLANAMTFQSGAIMSVPPADTRVRTPFMEYLERSKQDGATYQEKVEFRRSLNEGMRTRIYYRSYMTSDGAIFVAALSPSLRQKVRDALGIEYDPRDHDPNYDANSPEAMEFTRQQTDEWDQRIRAKESAYWVDLFSSHGVPAIEILFPEQLENHDQVLANDYLIELEHDVSGPQTSVAPPHKMSLSPSRPERAAPPLGRDTAMVLEQVGYTAEEIAALQTDCVIL